MHVKPIVCCWVQYARAKVDPRSIVLRAANHLSTYSPRLQSPYVAIRIEQAHRTPGTRAQSRRVRHREVQSAIQAVACETLGNLRISCQLRSKSKAYHDEAWSIEWMHNEVSRDDNSECLVCLDLEKLLVARDALSQLQNVLDCMILGYDIVSGVCEVAKWNDVIGGQYYSRDAWSGLPRHRTFIREMWNGGGNRQEWVREVAWLTIIGNSLRSKMPNIETVRSAYAEFPDGISQFRKQSVIERAYGLIFGAASSPEYYLAQPLDECTRLNAWLALELRTSNVLM